MPLLILLLSFSLLSPRARAADVRFPPDFVFGVANAPGQVEDELDDIWLRWGEEGHIAGWKSEIRPAERLRFWSQPETEFDLAKKLGVQSFRMGLDWGRVMPARGEFDEAAITRYREILNLAHARGLRVMLTLWHHSVPVWVEASGGWHSDENKDAFLLYARRMLTEFHDQVEWWITFNEANIFVNNAYVVGMWPPGEKASPFSFFAFGPFRGAGARALDRIAETHNELYTWAHEKFPRIQMGLAHNMAHYRGSGFFDGVTAWFADWLMNWRLTDMIRGHMDFFGINYYGAEWFSGDRIDLAVPGVEYSESGRAIDAPGLRGLLGEVHRRYGLPVIITENGIADREDGIRAAYLIEHLRAIHSAIADGIPVRGYYVWSLTDNLEWSDGYCPQFGLVAVDRKSFTRHPRPSFDLYHEIVTTGRITDTRQAAAWRQVVNLQGQNRPFCRAEDGVTAFGTPQPRPYSRADWRF